MEAERRQRGIAAYASQFGMSEAEVEQLFLERFGRRFAEEAFHVAGDAWQGEGLSLRDRSLIVLAVLATLGGVESRLRPTSAGRWSTARRPPSSMPSPASSRPTQATRGRRWRSR